MTTPSSSTGSAQDSSSRLCEVIFQGRGGQTASSIWRTHLDQILEAAANTTNGHVHRPWINDLLYHVAQPHLLERSVATRALHQPTVQGLLHKLSDRLHNASAPPLYVAVYGGSVAGGSGCDNIPAEVQKMVPPNAVPGGNSCAWPARLQVLADAAFGPGVVHVENLAVGATDSLIPLASLEYRLYANDSSMPPNGPDIIINAYAVNDRRGGAAATHERREEAIRKAFEDALFKSEQFARAALKSGGAGAGSSPPLVLFLDEYVGLHDVNQSILDTFIRNTAVQSVADVYGLASVVSAAIARPFAFANIREQVFTPSWFPQDGGALKRELHFGMIGHQHVAFTMAYAALRVAADFCVDRTEASHSNDGCDQESLPVPFQPNDTESTRSAETLSATSSRPIPPKLSNTLTFAALAHHLNETTTSTTRTTLHHSVPTCPFAFMAANGALGTVKNASALHHVLAPYISYNSGWQAEDDIHGWQNKPGLMAHKVGASITLTFANLVNPVRVVMVQYIKSYGPKWDGSSARFHWTVLNKESQPQQRGNSSSVSSSLTSKSDSSFELSGYQTELVSNVHQLRVDLKFSRAERGDTAQLKITLTGGTIFTIRSLVLCSA